MMYVSSSDSRNRQTRPIFIPGMMPAAAKRLTVFGCSRSSSAAHSALIRGSHLFARLVGQLSDIFFAIFFTLADKAYPSSRPTPSFVAAPRNGLSSREFSEPAALSMANC